MTTLAVYEAARAALAQVSTAALDQVMNLRDEIPHIRLYARKIKDRELLADAAELQMRVERRLGVLLEAAEQEGLLQRRGRPRSVPQAPAEATDEKCPTNGHFPPVTYSELDLDRRAASAARKQASIAEQAFEAAVSAQRERIRAGRAKVIEGSGHSNPATMSGRAEPADSLDYFPTPPWATRALIEEVLPRLGWHFGGRQALANASAWEPACGEGHIAEVLAEYFGSVRASDIHPYGYGDVADFLAVEERPEADWIITNPPFEDKAEAFVLRALELARVGVAMFVRLQWLESLGRYERVFQPYPPTAISFFAERVNLCKGRWDPTGTTATAYIWLVWIKGQSPSAPIWIKPGRRQALTRPDDVARFTAQPVTRRASLPAHDHDTGELVDEQLEAPELEGAADESQAKPDHETAAVAHEPKPPSGMNVPGVGEPARTGGLSWPAQGRTSNVSEMGATAGETAPQSDDAEWQALSAVRAGLSIDDELARHLVGVGLAAPDDYRPLALTAEGTARLEDLIAARVAASTPAQAAPAGDGLDIPAFLRRPIDQAVRT